MCQDAEVKLELLKREGKISGLDMYGADGGRLPLTQAAAVAVAAAGAVDDAPATEDSDSNSDADSIIGDAESSSERAKS